MDEQDLVCPTDRLVAGHVMRTRILGIADGKIESLLEILQSGDVNAHLQTAQGDTCLTWAVRNNQAESARWLLEHGADGNGKTVSVHPSHLQHPLHAPWNDQIPDAFVGERGYIASHRMPGRAPRVCGAASGRVCCDRLLCHGEGMQTRPRCLPRTRMQERCRIGGIGPHCQQWLHTTLRRLSRWADRMRASVDSRWRCH